VRTGRAGARRRGAAAPDPPTTHEERRRRRLSVGGDPTRRETQTRHTRANDRKCARLAFHSTTGRLNRRGHTQCTSIRFPTILLGNFASRRALSSRSPSWSSSSRRRVLLRHVHSVLSALPCVPPRPLRCAAPAISVVHLSFSLFSFSLFMSRPPALFRPVASLNATRYSPVCMDKAIVGDEYKVLHDIIFLERAKPPRAYLKSISSNDLSLSLFSSRTITTII